MKKDISEMRENYKKGLLLEKDISKSPFDQFKIWLDQAVSSEIIEANAMTIATVNAEGRPTSRVVLLKNMVENGFIFYTNYDSQKGKDLAINPFAAINFLWKEMERQVRIEGSVTKVSREQSESYFHSRPYGSQIGAISSHQSQVVEDRKVIEDRYETNYDRFEKAGVAPLPENWGGYILKPDYFEFWQGRESRLHDRIVYKLSDGKWITYRLEP